MAYRVLLFLLLSINFIFGQPIGLDESDINLYISDATYVYSNDVVITATKAIQMETATSNIFLRGDAQLYQIQDLKNMDAGELSVYQKQTTGIYEYNYWCSPVGVSLDGTVSENRDFNGSNIHDPQDDIDIENIVSTAYAFTTAYNGTTTQLSSYWLYTLISGGGYNGWNQIGSTENAAPGYGFTMKGSPNTNNTLDFRGRPNNGTFTIDCTFNGTDADPNSGESTQVSTLAGNPYPSALDLKEFIKVNTSVADGGTGITSVIEGEILFWEQAVTNSHYLAAYEGGYGVYSPGALNDDNDNGSYVMPPFQFYDNVGGGVGGSTNTGTDYGTASSVERRFAAIGQGFVITSKDNAGASSGGDVTFNNSMRLYMPEDLATGSIFGKNSTTKKSENTTKKIVAESNNGIDYEDIVLNPTIIPEIRIHTKINNNSFKETLIAFRETTPNNTTYNRFFDAKNQSSDLSSDVYLISDNTELCIKSIKYGEDEIVPFGVKLKGPNPVIKIKVHFLENVPEYINIYLHDNETNTYTDIINSSFDLNLPAGVYNDRFSITFKQNNSLSVNETETTFDNIRVLQNRALSQLEIYNSQGLNFKSFSLFDVSGKQVVQDNNVPTQNKITYSTKSLSDGVYISKLTTNTGQTFSKKVVISNRK